MSGVPMFCYFLEMIRRPARETPSETEANTSDATAETTTTPSTAGVADVTSDTAAVSAKTKNC